MSIGRLVVELELNDGQYTSRMTQAGRTAQTLSGQLNQVNRSLGGIQSGVTGAIPHLRDIAVVTSGLHSVFSMAQDTIGKFAGSLIKANAEVERTSILLQGLSKSVDSQGKLKDAAKDMEFLFETAKQAPFALKELSNSFVKMKVVGMTDVETKLKNITNAIASFGGSDESLHRTTVALQQMASKGVISMEELRQQLGESVPSAMQNMADGMGMTMSSMVKAISEGKVRALPAIDGMMQEMEFSMAGSSARMMQTWNGMFSQLETNWMLFQKKVGDGGSFEAIKTELGRLNDFLQSDSALKWAQTFGDALKTGIDGLHSMGEAWSKNSEMIGGALKMLLEFWVISKALKGLGNIVGATAETRALASSRLRPPTLKPGTPATPANWDPKNGAVTMGTAEGAATMIAGSATAMTALNAALAFMPGYLKLIPLAILGCVEGYKYFSNTAGKALDEISAKQEELNKKTLESARIEGDVALKTIEDIDKVKASIVEMESAKINAKRDVANSQNVLFAPQNASMIDTGLTAIANKFNGTDDLEKHKATVLRMETDISLAKKAVWEGSVEWFDRTEKRQIGIAKNSSETEMSIAATTYKNELKLIQEALDLEIKAGLDGVTANKNKHAAIVQLHKDTLASNTIMLDKMKVDAEAVVSGLRSKDVEIAIYIDSTKALKEAEDFLNLLRLAVAKTKLAIAATNDGGKSSGLASTLIGQQAEIDKAVANISTLKGTIEDIKGTGAITEGDLIDLSKATGTLTFVSEGMKKIVEYQKELAQNKLKGDDALMTGDTAKSLEAGIKRFEQAKAQLAKAVNDNLSLNNPKLATAMARQEDGSGAITDAMRDAANARINAGGDFKDKGNLVLSTSMSQLQTSAVGLRDPEQVKKLTLLIEANVDALNLETKAQEGLATATAGTAAAHEKLNELAKGGTFERETLAKLERQYGLEKGVLDALWQVESSRGKNMSTKDSSAQGHFAITNGTADTMGLNRDDRGDFEKSSQAAAKYLGMLKEKYNGSMDAALAAYKIGQGGFEKRGFAGVGQGTNADAGYLGKIRSVMNDVPDNKVIIEKMAEIENLRKNNQNHATQDNELAVLRKKQSLEDQYKEELKYYAGTDQLRAAQAAHEQTYAKYLNTLHTAERKERRDADALASRDPVGIYNNQIKDYQETNLKALENQHEAFKKDIEDALMLGSINKEMADDKLKAIDDQIAAENERATLEHKHLMDAKQDQIAFNRIRDTNNAIKTNTLGRATGVTTTKKAYMLAEEANAQAVDKIKSTDVGENSGNLQGHLDSQKALYADQLKQIEYDHRNAFEIMTQETVDFNMVAGQAAADFTNGMIDGLANMIVTGKGSFRDFAISIIQSIEMMIVKMLLLKAIQATIGMFGGGGNMGGEGIYSSTTGLGTAGPNYGLKFGGVVGGVHAFASGGSMLSNATKMTKRQMLAGGVKSKPHLALFAEADVPEAFIPMHDRKSIPISVMRDAAGNLSAKALLPGGKSIPATIQQSNFSQFAVGGMAGNISSDKVNGMSSGVNGNSANSPLANGAVSITINVDNKGDGSSKKDGAGKDGKQDEMWSKMADNIKGIVIKTIGEQKRPGGALWS